MSEDKRLTITVDEAGQLLGVSRMTAYHAVRIGQIPSFKIGKRVLIPRMAIERMVQAAAEPKPQKE